MGKISHQRRALKKQKAEAKKAAHEQMIRDANARHDAQFGSAPKITEYYKDYIQGTGLRQSK